MKFTCRKDNLLKSLSIVSKAIPIKHSFPILTNVLLVAKDGRLSLSGTNLDTAIITYVGADIEEEGTFTVPARELAEFISHIVSSETLTMSLTKDTLHITSGATKSKFNGITAQDYPELPALDESLACIELSPKDFSSAISQVGFSVALDDSRPVFSGILVKYEANKLYFVASDGFRLTEKILDVESEIDDFTVILPAKTLMEVARIFGSCDEKVKIFLSQDKNLCLFQCEDILVSSRVIDGAYPDYRRIIPKETKINATFDSAKLHEAVKLTNVFTKNSSNSLRLLFDPSGVLKVYSTSEEVGENNTEIVAEIEGDSLEIMFNSKYMLDFLSNNKFQTLQFGANDNGSPCVIRPVDDVTFLHVMAPMQSNE